MIFDNNTEFKIKDLDYSSHFVDGFHALHFVIYEQNANKPLEFCYLFSVRNLSVAIIICKILSFFKSGSKFYIWDPWLAHIRREKCRKEDRHLETFVFEYCGLDTVIKKEN